MLLVLNYLTELLSKKLMKKIFLYITVLLLLSACGNQIIDFEASEYIFSCNAETINEEQNLFFSSESENVFFKGGNQRSDSISKSGKYSILLNPENPYGMALEIPNAKIDDHYEVTVYRYKNNSTAKIVANGKGFWFGQEIANEDFDENWEKIIFDFYIPPNYTGDKIKIYLWNPTEQNAYFDDFQIKKLAPKEYPIFEESALYIYIDEFEMEKINQKRFEAFENKILTTEDDSWVKAIVFYQGESMKAEVRLKGDWLDHLEGKKWSFRIKLKKGNSWNGMRTFSIQTPVARNFIDEWLVHKIFENEDILTTRYDFVPVYLNNENLGLYVYEEHFEKQLVEYKNRREGPILKFGEDQLWTARVFGEESNFNNFEASIIQPFKENKTINSENLFNQFKIAQNLLYQYKYCLTKTSDIFDVDKIAKYCALVDLSKSYHGIIWHNQRFYYNPVICRLEPIAFDNYYDKGVMSWTSKAIYGNNFNENTIPKINGFYNFQYLMTDSIFVKKYTFYLEKFSNDNYIDSTLAIYNSEIQNLEKNIQKEFETYKYDYDFLKTNAENIRKELEIFVKRNFTEIKNIEFERKFDYKSEYQKEIAEKMIQAYKQLDGTIKIINYYTFDIELIGFSIDKSIISDPFDENIIINSFNNPENYKLIKPEQNNVEYFAFKIENEKDIIILPVLKWNFPFDYNPQKEMIGESLELKNHFKILNDEIIIESGNYQFDSTIVIPKNYKLIIEANTTIDLIDSASLISYSTIYCKANKENPIIIKSSDNSSNSFTVLQAEEKSIFEYVTFENLNTLNYKGWNLTGAVNFYESDVELVNVTIKSNHCEDALNIIRSDFLVEKCYILDTYADAFDSDFSTGIVKNTIFEQLGNDAIDFSTSVVEITDCKIIQATDKGISGGERSYLTIKNCEITNSNIGISSKDLSELTVESTKISNCVYGLVLLQKKPEYGPAKIFTDNFEWENVTTPFLIEKKSIVNLNGSEIQGTEKDVYEMFYQ